MSWIIEITKLLAVSLITIVILVAGIMFFPLNNSKATALDVYFHLAGSRLAVVGVLNILIGLVLSRLTVIGGHLGLR